METRNKCANPLDKNGGIEIEPYVYILSECFTCYFLSVINFM